MKLIVGLGNPGNQYRDTRHNIGFVIADSIAKDEVRGWHYSPDYLGYFIKTSDFVLLKPSTFMNKSGEAVRNISNFFKIDKKDILAIHDDLDLEFGRIRVSFDSSSAGHNGVASIIKSLGTMDFTRLRIGISHPRQKELRIDVDKYVLEKFDEAEVKELGSIIGKSKEAVKTFITSGIDATMNAFN